MNFWKNFGFADSIKIQENKDGIPSNAISIVQEGIEVFIPFKELVDVEKELERLNAEKERLENEVERASKMLANKGFVEKAPKAKIEEEELKLQKYKDMLDTTIKRIEEMK